MTKGFTLVETIVAITIFSLLMVGVVEMVVSLYKTHDYTFQQAVAVEEARRGIHTMIKEIREGRMGDDGAYLIACADDYQFCFYSDIDKDEDVERVRYFLDGNYLKKGVIDPQGIPAQYLEENEKISIISSYVRNSPPIFRYYDENGEELPVPARKKDTKLLEVYLVINVDPQRKPDDVEILDGVEIRNLRITF